MQSVGNVFLVFSVHCKFDQICRLNNRLHSVIMVKCDCLCLWSVYDRIRFIYPKARARILESIEYALQQGDEKLYIHSYIVSAHSL